MGRGLKLLTVGESAPDHLEGIEDAAGLSARRPGQTGGVWGDLGHAVLESSRYQL